LVSSSAGTDTALEVSPGETVLPGQVVLALANLHRLQVETTDSSERDVDRVAVGQQATVYVEALGLDVEGRVVRIAHGQRRSAGTWFAKSSSNWMNNRRICDWG
jgi:multidrug resistance efflux pump